MAAVFQPTVFQRFVFQAVGAEAQLEVRWPGTTVRKKKKKKNDGPDIGLIQELIRQRDEAIAAWRAKHETAKEEPEVVVELPKRTSESAKRAIRKVLAPLDIKIKSDLSAVEMADARIVRAQQLIELRRREDEEIVLLLAAA